MLGNDGISYDTNYKDDFFEKERQGERAKPIRKGENCIEFGDSLTDFTSTYNKVYDSKPRDPTKVAAPSMRKTNLILGNDNSNFQTQSQNAYQPL